MEVSTLSDAEFNTLVIRMLKEISQDLNSIKKIQSEMKDTLIKIKNNRKTTVEQTKSRLKSMMCNTWKQITTN